MSTKGNKDLVRQFLKELDAYIGDEAKTRSVFEKYCAPDGIYHHISRGDMKGDQFAQFYAEYMAAFPDAKTSIDDQVAEGDKVATRYTMKATHKGMYRGMPATGKQIVLKGVEIDKIVKGKLVETWDFPDMLGVLTQLGLVPAPKT